MNEQGEKNTAFRRIAFQFAGTVSLVAALLIIVPLITVYFLTQSFDNKIRSEINHTSNYVQRTVLAFIDGAYNLSYELSVNPSILSMETDIQTPVIKDTTDRNEYLELIFIQDMSGMQTARSAGELAYRGDRWWFNEVKNKRMPFISQSYYSIFTHTPCASIFLPLFDDSEMVGVFGVDIKLEYIQNLVEHFAEHDTGRYSFVMDGEGVVLAHPDSAYIETLVNYKNLTRTLLVLDGDGVAIRDELDNFVTVEEQFNVSDGFKSVINSVMSGNSGTYTIDAGYTTYYVSYEPINMPGYSDSWSVITLRDRTVAMEVVTNLVTGILIVLTMAFVVFIIFAMFLYRSLRKTMINLESSRQEAEEANISKSNFLAMMSHEIRTPMNAIIGIAQIELSKETMPDTYVSAFGKILASGNSLLGIINDILDMSKIEMGKMEIIPAVYDTPSLINDTVQLNIVRIGSKPIEFYLEVDEKLPSKVIGDILRLKQVLSNLLSNAIKYTSKGYAKLSVTFEEDGEDIILYLKVEDTGQGLKPEDLERMFSAYIRFNATANRTTEGTGLGLSITKRLVEMMDGTISVESEYGKGSIFTVALRQKTVDCPPIGAELANKLQNSLFFLSENHLAGLRIDRDPMPYGKVLVVDDVETNLLVAEGLMNPYKLEIETANSGFEAIDIISAGNVYDIIFMDHMMPDMDGIEATARLRELGYTEPIVALTANAVAGQADVFMQNGFDAFVSKPIDIRQLDAALNRFIRDKQTPEVIEAARKQYADAKADSDSKKKSDTLLIDSFIRDARKTLSVLDEVMQRDKYGKDDIQRYIVVVHGIKSSLLNIGEKELSEQAYSLEQAGRNGDKSVIKENSPGFVEKVNNLLEALEEKREQEKQSAPEETGDIHGKLLELADLCADYNRKGAMELLEGIGKCSAETQAVIDELKENVLHSQFEDAESAARGFCEKIADKQENTKEDQ